MNEETDERMGGLKDGRIDRVSAYFRLSVFLRCGSNSECVYVSILCIFTLISHTQMYTFSFCATCLFSHSCNKMNCHIFCVRYVSDNLVQHKSFD